MAKTKKLLTFDIQGGSGFCCGLAEIGSFMVEEIGPSQLSLWEAERSYSTASEAQWPPESKDKAFFATTTARQKDAAKRLKKMGFKAVGTWKRDSGAKLTMWGFFPTRKKRRKGK